MLDIIWSELTAGLPDQEQLGHVLVRLTAAALLGAVVGWQRERAGKPAGLRTHMLVTLGSTVFVLAASLGDFDAEGMSRVIQGVATGIGFIGAGAILKLQHEREIKGLTTAASIWMATAVGVAVGVGALGLALLAAAFAWIVLAMLGWFEERAAHKAGKWPS